MRFQIKEDQNHSDILLFSFSSHLQTKHCVYSSESELNQPIVSYATANHNVAAVIQNFNHASIGNGAAPPLPPKPRSTMRTLGMVSNPFMQGASASATALNSMNHTLNNGHPDRKLTNSSTNNLANCNHQLSPSSANKPSTTSTQAVKPDASSANHMPTATHQAVMAEDLLMNKANRSMSVSDICKVFEKQQGLVGSVTSSASSSTSQSNSISPSEKIKINKNLEMRKRELFGKDGNGESASSNDSEPKSKVTKFSNGGMIKSTVESLVSQYKAKSTSSLSASNSLTSSTSSITQKLNNLTPVKEHSISTASPIKEIEQPAKSEHSFRMPAGTSSSFSSSISPNSSVISSGGYQANDSSSTNLSAKEDEPEAGSPILAGQVRSTNRAETFLNTSLSRELEPPKINRNTAKYTAEVLNELIEQASKSIEEELLSQNIKHTIEIIVLQRESARTGSIGITLAGGADYENKEITVGVRCSGNS